MIPLLTREEVRALDAHAIAGGVAGLVLMENAGRGAADALLARLDANARVKAEFGYGPVGSNPATSPDWIWFSGGGAGPARTSDRSITSVRTGVSLCQAAV